MRREEYAVGVGRKHLWKTSRESEMLGWRRETRRWEVDPVRRLEMLGRRRLTPRWKEEPMRWRIQGLEKQRRQGNR